MARQFASHGVEDQRSGEVSFVFHREHLINFVNLIAGISVRESSMEYRLGWNDGQIYEREACAELVENFEYQDKTGRHDVFFLLPHKHVAKAILARNID
jgi:hypothetical protein